MKRFLALSAILFLLTAQSAFAVSGTTSYVELTDAPTITVDWSKSGNQFVTLHGNRAFVFLNGEKGKHYTLAITQDATGTRVPNWPASVRCQAGTCPGLTSTAGKTDYVGFVYNGINYDMLALSQNF